MRIDFSRLPKQPNSSDIVPKTTPARSSIPDSWALVNYSWNLTPWGENERVTHPICVDCAIQTEPDPDERDHYACDGCGLVVDALAASPARCAGCKRDLRSRPADALLRRTRSS